MPKDEIEDLEGGPRERVRQLVANLDPISNTIQYSWLIEMCQSFFGFTQDFITADNWEPLYDTAEQTMSQADWAEQVLAKSRIEAVFLTNNFDDPLDGFDTNVYVPCLRTDDLVFHLGKEVVQRRLSRCTESAITNADNLRMAIAKLFEHFTNNKARACAISLPP